MGRPGRLGLRDCVRGGNGQFSFENYTAGIISLRIAKITKEKQKIKKIKKPIFEKNGHVTLRSISERREFFLGKSVKRIEHELNKYGYVTRRRKGNHKGSKAVIIEILNPSKERNIAQVQISPGSKRHGNVPYVKISTKDIGKIKIVDSTKDKYKTDGVENAIILFRRK